MDETSSRPPSLLKLPAYLMANVSRIGHRELEAELGRHDLRLPHYAILLALSDFGAMAQHELADRLDGNRSHAVGYLDHLQELELVARERDPADRRRQNVTLTPQGTGLLDTLARDVARATDAMLQPLTDAERKTLAALLRRILQAHDSNRIPKPDAGAC